MSVRSWVKHWVKFDHPWSWPLAPRPTYNRPIAVWVIYFLLSWDDPVDTVVLADRVSVVSIATMFSRSVDCDGLRRSFDLTGSQVGSRFDCDGFRCGSRFDRTGSRQCRGRSVPDEGLLLWSQPPLEHVRKEPSLPSVVSTYNLQ